MLSTIHALNIANLSIDYRTLKYSFYLWFYDNPVAWCRFTNYASYCWLKSVTLFVHRAPMLKCSAGISTVSMEHMITWLNLPTSIVIDTKLHNLVSNVFKTVLGSCQCCRFGWCVIWFLNHWDASHNSHSVKIELFEVNVDIPSLSGLLLVLFTLAYVYLLYFVQTSFQIP